MSMYRWLVGNLRLWTIQELVSSISNNTKAYRAKQEFSRCGYIVHILSSRMKKKARYNGGCVFADSLS